MNIDDMIEVMQAAKEGEFIEVSGIGDNSWHDLTHPTLFSSWDFMRYEYRIKKIPREYTLIATSMGQVIDCKSGIHTIDNDNESACQVIHVREIIE